jgi:hypothetical protein
VEVCVGQGGQGADTLRWNRQCAGNYRGERGCCIFQALLSYCGIPGYSLAPFLQVAICPPSCVLQAVQDGVACLCLLCSLGLLHAAC